MPTYDFRCRACGHCFEAMQSMKDKPLEICPKCGKPEVERLISAGGGLLFKGSGFYITDYRKDSYKKDSKKDSGDSGTTKTPDPKPKATTSE